MQRRISFFAIITVLVLAATLLPKDIALAKIADGRYELNYEMKEAGSENTSIADGYFTKPAILTVENGVQYIQMTVTGSNYVESLAAPSGPVEVVSEDTTNFVRTVKFRVDGDLSKPLDMEMRIIVPDLYDMTHTARAVFDLSPLKTTTAPPANEGQNTSKTDSSKTTNQPVEKKEEEKDTTVANTDNDKNTEEPEVSVKEEEKEEDQAETEEAEIVEEDNEDTAKDANSEEEEEISSEEAADTQVEDSQEEENSSNAGFIVLLIIGVIIVVLAMLMVRKKRSN